MSAAEGSIGRFLLRGGSVALVSRLLAVAAGFAVQVMLARLIPPAHLGAYFLTQSLVLVLATLAPLGMTQPLSRMLAQRVGSGDPQGARGVLGMAFRIALISIGVASLAYASGAGSWLGRRVFDSPVMAGGALTAAVWIGGAALESLFASALRGYHRVGLAAFLGGALTSLLLASGLAVLWIWRGASDFETVLLVAAAGTWVNVAVCGIALRGSVRGVAPVRSISWRDLLRSGLPVLGTGVMSIAVVQADLWVVGALLLPEDVAVYGAAKRLVRLVGLPLVVVSQVLQPLVASLYARQEVERLQRVVRGVATLAGVPALLALVAFLVSGEWILALVFGEFYAAGDLLLRILCLERIVFVLVGPTTALLLMTGHEGAVFRIYAWTGLLWILALCVGGLVAGAAGVAVGFALSSAIREGWLLVEAWRRTGIRAHVNPFHLPSMIEALRGALRRSG